jgi:hypothetical protein
MEVALPLEVINVGSARIIHPARTPLDAAPVVGAPPGNETQPYAPSDPEGVR